MDRSYCLRKGGSVRGCLHLQEARKSCHATDGLSLGRFIVLTLEAYLPVFLFFLLADCASRFITASRR